MDLANYKEKVFLLKSSNVTVLVKSTSSSCQLSRTLDRKIHPSSRCVERVCEKVTAHIILMASCRDTIMHIEQRYPPFIYHYNIPVS
jgi:hypothetical protein